MKLKSEKGFTVIDISIAVIVVFIFISLIAILIYNQNSYSQEIELKSKATNIAVQEIEKMKNKTLEDLETEDTTYREPKEIETGFTREIIVQDYHDINPEKIPNIVKKVTVQVKYKFKKEIQTIEISTVISKEN